VRSEEGVCGEVQEKGSLFSKKRAQAGADMRLGKYCIFTSVSFNFAFTKNWEHLGRDLVQYDCNFTIRTERINKDFQSMLY